MANNNETSIIISAVDKSEAALKGVQSNLGQVGNDVARLQGLVTGFAAVAGVGMFANMIKGSIESMAGLQQLSEQTGATVEGLSAMRSVARLSGTDMGEVGGALQKLSKNMVGLDDDSKEASKAITAIGLSATELKNLKPDEAMKAIADAMANYGDGAEKTAIAMALFGKAGANALPFLKDLAEAGQLNAKVTAEQAKMADDLEKNFSKLSMTGQGWQKELTAGMLPALTSFSEAALSTINGVGGLREEMKKLSADGTINDWAVATLNGISYVSDAIESVARLFTIAGKTIGAYYASLVMAASGDFSGIKNVWAELKSDVDGILNKPLLGQRLREAFEKTQEAKKQALLDYGKSVTDVIAAYAGYDIKIQQAAMKSLAESYFGGEEKPRAKYSSSDGGAAAKVKNELQVLLDKISGKDLGLDATYWKDLETLNKGYRSGKLSVDEYSTAVGKLTQQQKFAKDIADKEAEAVKALGVEWAKQSEIFWEEVKAREAASKVYQDTIDKLDQEAETLGMTSEAAQRYIATQELLKQKKQGLIESEDEYLDRLEKINAAFDRRDASKSIADAAKKAAEEWKKTGEIIEQSLTDALMRGFESGKGFGENFRDTLVNMFKTLVLRPVIQATVQGGLAAVGLGAPGAASAGGGVGGLLSAGNSAYSMASGGGMAGGFLSGMASAGGEAALGAAFVGPSAQLAGGSIGVGANVGSLFGSAASGIAAALPWVGGALAIGSVLGLFGDSGPVDRNSKYQRAFGASDSSTGTPQAGGADPWRSNFRFSDSEMATSLASYNAGLIASEQNAIKSLGLTSDQIAAINVELNKSADAVYNFGIEHSDWLASTADEQIAAVRLQAMATALGKSVAEIAAAMDPLFGALVNAGKSIGLTSDQLLKVAGTSEQMQALTGNIGAYYAAFFTEQEKLAKAGDAFSAEFSKLGLAVPATKTEFRALVESLDLTTEAGQKSFAGLMSLSGAFAQYADAATAATAATQSATAAADASRKAVLAEQRARDSAAASTVADLTAAYAGLQSTLRNDARGTSGGSLGALGFSAAEAASVSQFAEYIDNANAKLDEIAKSPFAAELAGYTTQIKALAKSVQDQAADTLSAGRLSSGDVAGALAAQMAKTPLQFSDFMPNRQGARPDRSDFSTRADFDAAFANWDAKKFNAGAFNAAQELSRVQASISLGNQASANALNVQNVGAVLGQLGQVAQSDEFRFALNRQLADSVQVPIQGALMDVLYNAFDAATSALLQSDFTAKGVGLAGVRAQQAQLAVYQTGSDVAAYEGAIRNLNAALKAGVLGSADYETGLRAVNTLFAAVIPFVGDLDAQAQRITQASFELGTTGLSSIGYYFGQIGKQADQLAASAAAVSEPIAQATEAIGRMQSISTVFGESAIAAYRGLAGAGEQGAAYLSGGATQASIGNAALVSAAAGIAAEIMTTADAAKVAEKLSGQFTGSQRRDAALLLDGIQEYNAASFEKAFTRINAALARGGINEAQYIELFAQGVESFRGVDREAAAMKTAMQSLAEAMGGFADRLLIDQQRTTIGAVQSLAELNRQYAVARDSATSGDREAVGKYQSLASSMLDKGLYDNQAAYNDAFGRVYGDARNLESVGVNALANLNDGSNVVSELKNLNTSLSNRVEQLEKNLTIALAQIAKNTSRTSSGIEQINTVGLPA